VTIERAALVEFWPLVDIARVGIKEGDAVVLSIRDRELLGSEARQRLRETMEAALPGVRILVADAAKLDFIVHRSMPEMRAEDLLQPERTRNME
jgi:hypothetical protein